jgi:hypothetical protein
MCQTTINSKDQTEIITVWSFFHPEKSNTRMGLKIKGVRSGSGI